MSLSHQTPTAAVSTLLVSFRTIKVEVPLTPDITAGHVKQAVLDAVSDDSLQLAPSDLRLLLKGKTLRDDDQKMLDWVLTSMTSTSKNGSKKLQKSYRILVTGRSEMEAQAIVEDHEDQRKTAPRIRDDLTDQGKRDLARRQRLGQQALQRAAVDNNKQHSTNQNYGFGKIETLPGLPNEDQSRNILTTLANDPGILACMAKHQWTVGSLAELAPDGQVGQSTVCVMGLNRNKGQQILLRLRTDDYQGFRKILSIRKVLYHELAHNVHSEHDKQFFQLMRQIERECTELDWTQGAGTTDGFIVSSSFEGGAYRLGGAHSGSHLTPRELAARAAMQRMTAEEEEIQQHCGCGKEALFLPPTTTNTSTRRPDESAFTTQKHDDRQSQNRKSSSSTN